MDDMVGGNNYKQKDDFIRFRPHNAACRFSYSSCVRFLEIICSSVRSYVIDTICHQLITRISMDWRKEVIVQ